MKEDRRQGAVKHKHKRHHAPNRHVQPSAGFEAEYPDQVIRALMDSGSSNNLIHYTCVLANGGEIDYDGPKLCVTKAQSQDLGGSMGPIRPGTCSLPLVNSERQIEPLPLGANDHACDMSGLGGAQSLVAVGSHDWMSNRRDMLTIMTELSGELHSDNTADATTPSNVFPLPMGPSGTPMLPIAGVECSQESSAMRKSRIAVAPEISGDPAPCRSDRNIRTPGQRHRGRCRERHAANPDSGAAGAATGGGQRGLAAGVRPQQQI